MATKQFLRDYYRALRNGLTDKDIADRSDEIARQLGLFLAGKPVVTVHSFLPARGRNEVDTVRIRQLQTEAYPGLRWVYPRMREGSFEMNHYALYDGAPLIVNRWGIPEPDPDRAQEVDVNDIDIVLVPLLIFDLQGHRVGYGGGYYDRFLAQCPSHVIKAGVSLFDEPVDTIDDAGVYDIALDICLTPQRIWSWSKG